MKKRISLILAVLMLISTFAPMSAFAGVSYKEGGFEKKYPATYSALKQDMCIPIDQKGISLNFDEHLPQGVTIYGDYVLMSAYTNQKDANDKQVKNQFIEIYDKNTTQFVGEISLKLASHMGGITVAENRVWVSSTTKLFSFDISKVDEAIKNGQSTVKSGDVVTQLEFKKEDRNWFQRVFIDNVWGADDSENYSYCTYYNGYLWVGSYTMRNDGRLRQVKIDSSGNASFTGNEIKTPQYVQGASIYNDNRGTEYVLFSARYSSVSYTYFIASYPFDGRDLKNKDYLIRQEVCANVEESVIDATTNTLYLAFENINSKYSSGKKMMVDDILAIDLTCLIPSATVQEVETQAETTTSAPVEETTVEQYDYSVAESMIYDTAIFMGEGDYIYTFKDDSLYRYTISTAKYENIYTLGYLDYWPILTTHGMIYGDDLYLYDSPDEPIWMGLMMDGGSGYDGYHNWCGYDGKCYYANAIDFDAPEENTRIITSEDPDTGYGQKYETINGKYGAERVFKVGDKLFASVGYKNHEFVGTIENDDVSISSGDYYNTENEIYYMDYQNLYCYDAVTNTTKELGPLAAQYDDTYIRMDMFFRVKDRLYYSITDPSNDEVSLYYYDFAKDKNEFVKQLELA